MHSAPSRITQKFEELRQRKQKALITFVTAGDPDLRTTEKVVLEMEVAGADLIEIGIPFSDPMADGPVIQRASERALEGGTTLKKILELVSSIRKKSQVPLILMGYYNSIFVYGPEKFCKEAALRGVDGLIVVDLPAEEAAELQIFTKKYNLNLIYLLTPTSHVERIEKVKKLASGFVYYVSITGVTGASLPSTSSIQKEIRLIRQSLNLPICIGFGVRTPEDARKIARIADGVVVGSALVSLIEKKQFSEIPRKIQEFKDALRS